jgi:hypothetical protein
VINKNIKNKNGSNKGNVGEREKKGRIVKE